MMGPSLIFDKSLLQALNPDESMWLDNFFISNITPLLYIETLADLEKEIHSGKTPEQFVGDLAYKTPDTGCINTHHNQLIYGELTRQGKIEMAGRPVISRGEVKKLGDELGVIYNEPEEIVAFKRWKNGEFIDLERTLAKRWRKELLEDRTLLIEKISGAYFRIFSVPKTFEELLELVENILKAPNQRETLKFCLLIKNLSQEAEDDVLKEWDSLGINSVEQFAPYFTYTVKIDLFYMLGTAANLFSVFKHPQTHFIDIAYLYYLPFCNVFVSNDKLHLEVAKYFLRQDQSLINGVELKDDLKNLDNYYDAFPQDVKERGVMSFAGIPPDDVSFLVTRLWDKYMSSSWREIKTRKFDGSDDIDPKKEKEILEKMSKFVKESKPVGEAESKAAIDGIHSVYIQHMASAQKGKWKRFPRQVIDSEKRIFDRNKDNTQT